jgi:hypothetical protein
VYLGASDLHEALRRDDAKLGDARIDAGAQDLGATLDNTFGPQLAYVKAQARPTGRRAKACSSSAMLRSMAPRR